MVFYIYRLLRDDSSYAHGILGDHNSTMRFIQDLFVKDKDVDIVYGDVDSLTEREVGDILRTFDSDSDNRDSLLVCLSNEDAFWITSVEDSLTRHVGVNDTFYIMYTPIQKFEVRLIPNIEFLRDTFEKLRDGFQHYFSFAINDEVTVRIDDTETRGSFSSMIDTVIEEVSRGKEICIMDGLIIIMTITHHSKTKELWPLRLPKRPVKI